jgi:RNA polymerase sigma factor (TIGR02999 family)
MFDETAAENNPTLPSPNKGLGDAERKGEITALLTAWRNGNDKAGDLLMRIVYGELRRVARRIFRGERTGHTLQTTALIHEVYLRLVGTNVQWQNSAHFFRIAAQAMRRLLVDHARRKNAAKRGGAEVNVSLCEVNESSPKGQLDVLALNEALGELATIDPRSSQIVELRYFAGLTLEETAKVLGVSLSMVKSDWSFAKYWLYRRLKDQSRSR